MSEVNEEHVKLVTDEFNRRVREVRQWRNEQFDLIKAGKTPDIAKAKKSSGKTKDSQEAAA